MYDLRNSHFPYESSETIKGPGHTSNYQDNAGLRMEDEEYNFDCRTFNRMRTQLKFIQNQDILATMINAIAV